MRKLASVWGLCVILCLPACSSRSENKDGTTATVQSSTTTTSKKEPTNAEKIVGTWEITKAPEVPPGATFEFTRDGRMKMTVKVEGQTATVEGTYKVEGDTLTTVMKEGPKEVTEKSKIKTLNSTTLITEDEKGQAVEFKKK